MQLFFLSIENYKTQQQKKITSIPQAKQQQRLPPRTLQVPVVDKIEEHTVMNILRPWESKEMIFSLVSPAAGTTDRRHSHFNRLSSVNNQTMASHTQNSEDEEEENDDNESVSTQSTQPISLTSFIPLPTTTATNDYHPGVNSSLRQTRQRLNIQENSSSSQPRTRYSTRSSTSHRNHDEDYDIRQTQQHAQASSSRMLSASEDDDEDHDISSNNKRNRIERSDRRITSINRPNYKIDSDEHEDEEEDDDDHQEAMNTTNDNHDDNQSTEKIHEKDKSKTI